MLRMWLIENTGLSILRCLRWWAPVSPFSRETHMRTGGSIEPRTESSEKALTEEKGCDPARQRNQRDNAWHECTLSEPTW